MSHDDLTTRPVRWGILGAGGIASSLAADITRTDGHVVAAVAARDGERAAEFARRYDAPRRTRSTGSTPSPRSPPASRCWWRSP